MTTSPSNNTRSSHVTSKMGYLGINTNLFKHFMQPKLKGSDDNTKEDIHLKKDKSRMSFLKKKKHENNFDKSKINFKTNECNNNIEKPQQTTENPVSNGHDRHQSNEQVPYLRNTSANLTPQKYCGYMVVRTPSEKERELNSTKPNISKYDKKQVGSGQPHEEHAKDRLNAWMHSNGKSTNRTEDRRGYARDIQINNNPQSNRINEQHMIANGHCKADRRTEYRQKAACDDANSTCLNAREIENRQKRGGNQINYNANNGNPRSSDGCTSSRRTFDENTVTHRTSDECTSTRRTSDENTSNRRKVLRRESLFEKDSSSSESDDSLQDKIALGSPRCFLTKPSQVKKLGGQWRSGNGVRGHGFPTKVTSDNGPLVITDNINANSHSSDDRLYENISSCRSGSRLDRSLEEESLERIVTPHIISTKVQDDGFSQRLKYEKDLIINGHRPWIHGNIRGQFLTETRNEIPKKLNVTCDDIRLYENIDSLGMSNRCSNDPANANLKKSLGKAYEVMSPTSLINILPSPKINLSNNTNKSQANRTHVLQGISQNQGQHIQDNTIHNHTQSENHSPNKNCGLKPKDNITEGNYIDMESLHRKVVIPCTGNTSRGSISHPFNVNPPANYKHKDNLIDGIGSPKSNPTGVLTTPTTYQYTTNSHSKACISLTNTTPAQVCSLNTTWSNSHSANICVRSHPTTNMTPTTCYQVNTSSTNCTSTNSNRTNNPSTNCTTTTTFSTTCYQPMTHTDSYTPIENFVSVHSQDITPSKFTSPSTTGTDCITTSAHSIGSSPTCTTPSTGESYKSTPSSYFDPSNIVQPRFNTPPSYVDAVNRNKLENLKDNWIMKSRTSSRIKDVEGGNGNSAHNYPIKNEIPPSRVGNGSCTPTRCTDNLKYEEETIKKWPYSDTIESCINDERKAIPAARKLAFPTGDVIDSFKRGPKNSYAINESDSIERASMFGSISEVEIFQSTNVGKTSNVIGDCSSTFGDISGIETLSPRSKTSTDMNNSHTKQSDRDTSYVFSESDSADRNSVFGFHSDFQPSTQIDLPNKSLSKSDSFSGKDVIIEYDATDSVGNADEAFVTRNYDIRKYSAKPTEKCSATNDVVDDQNKNHSDSKKDGTFISDAVKTIYKNGVIHTKSLDYHINPHEPTLEYRIPDNDSDNVSIEKHVHEALSEFSRFGSDRSKASSSSTNNNYDRKRRKIHRSPFTSLPDIVIVRILSFLGTTMLCRCVRVCRRWYSLVWDVTLWTHVRISDERVNVDAGLNCLTKQLSYDTPTVCVTVQNVCLNGCVKLTDRGLRIIAKRCPELQVLELRGCGRITGDGVSVVLSSCVNIVNLDLSGCHNVSRVSPDVTHHSAFHHQILLTHLNLSECVTITDNSVRAITLSCTRLQYLYMRHCVMLTDKVLVSLSKHCTGLVELSISDCGRVTDKGVRELAKLEQLRYLSIAKCENVSDDSMKIVTKFCKMLKYVNMRGCRRVSDDTLISLGENVTGLRSLDVGSCDVTDEGLIAISEKCRNLKKLSLKLCDTVTDEGIVAIATNCLRLQQINVHGCHVTLLGYNAVKTHCPQCLIEHSNPGFI